MTQVACTSNLIIKWYKQDPTQGIYMAKHLPITKAALVLLRHQNTRVLAAGFVWGWLPATML